MKRGLLSVILSTLGAATLAAFGDEIIVENPSYTPGSAPPQSRWSIRNFDLGNNYFVAMTLQGKYVIKVDANNDVATVVTPQFDAGQNNMFRCGNLLMSAHSVNFKTFLWNEGTETMTGPIQTYTQANMLADSGIATRSQDTYAGGWTSDCTKYFYPISSASTDTGFGWFDVNPSTGTFTWGGIHLCSASICAGKAGVTSYGVGLTNAFGVSSDGLHVFFGVQEYGEDATAGGAVLHYKYSGGTWGEAWLTPPSTTVGHDFGFQVVVVNERLFVTAGTTLQDAFSNIYVYDQANSIYTLSDTIPYTMARMAIGGISNPGNEMRICTYSHYPANVANSGTINTFDLVDGIWTNTVTKHGQYAGSKWGYEGGTCGNDYIMTFDSYFTMETYGSTGRVYIFGTPTAPVPPPQCTVSADCATGTYCKAFSCYTEKTCTTHAECAGELDAGRLPYCEKSTSKCKDKKASTCATPSLCITEAIKLERDTNSIGSIQQTVSVADGATRTAAASSLITKLKNTTSVTSDMVVFVSSTETMTLDSALFTENDEAAMLASIADVRCGASADQCTVSIVAGNRRRLGHLRELVGSYTVEITFDVTDEAFAIIDGSTALDDPGFAEALALAAGVNASEVDISTTSGDLVITFTLTDQSVEGEPTDPNSLNEINSIQSSLTAVTEEVVTEFAISGTDIVTADVDLCNTRDCGGFGAELCDAGTGVCDCPEGWWGVNCDTQTNCNGGIAVGSYCHCTFPKYGQRCTLVSGCNETCA